MNKKAKEQQKSLERPCCELKSLEEITMRQVVNQMKIKIEQERLMLAIMPGGVSTDAVVADTASKFENILQYVTLGISTYRMVKKGIDFFRNVKN